MFRLPALLPQTLHDGRLRRKKQQLCRLLRRDPAHVSVFKPLRLLSAECAAQHAQVHREIRVWMRQLHELRPDMQMHAEFFPAFARKRLLLRLARLDLSAGKFPQKCARLSFRTLTQQNMFTVLDQRRHDFQHPLTTLSCNYIAACRAHQEQIRKRKNRNPDVLPQNSIHHGGVFMFTAAVWLMFSSILCSLRLSSAGGSFPKPLTAAEERYYLARSAEGDLEARNILIERNLRLVAHIMKKYYTPSADQEDLISIGTIGLIKGISTFDASKGARLATYAARCVENEILMYFRSLRKGAQDVSLSDCIETGRDGNALSLLDTICSEEDLFEELSTRELHGQLRALVERILTPREKLVVTLRYGLDGNAPLTQREIAAQCGISRSYVSRIEKKALKTLQDALLESGSCK